MIQEDLGTVNEKDKDSSGFSYSPLAELLFKNSLRQIEFLSSDLVSQKQIFKELFELQGHYEPILHFRGYIKDDNWNTPNQLREPMRIIEKKADEERSNWHKVREVEGRKVTNQHEVNKYILKRNIIRIVMSLFKKQMEKRNAFLDEGYFSIEDFENQANDKTAIELFFVFIGNAALKMPKAKSKKIFEGDTLRLLIEKIYEAIDLTKSEHDVANTSLRTTKEFAIQILQLQRKFLYNLNRYYSLFHDPNELIEKDIVEEFVNYMPYERRMSSGENALLNLFSRLYTFLEHNIRGNKFVKVHQHYILLLDEADLGFHPKWKRRFIKAILKTIPFFFNQIDSSPSIQIIFTTHDPLTLSDLPNQNVIYLSRPDYDSETLVLNTKEEGRPSKTFGANVAELLADSFFMENSLIGDFAFDKIHETIIWLNQLDNKERKDYYQKLIQTIDEPIIQRKLAEMYDDKMNEDFQLKIVDQQMEELLGLRKKLRK